MVETYKYKCILSYKGKLTKDKIYKITYLSFDEACIDNWDDESKNKYIYVPLMSAYFKKISELSNNILIL
jgi:hypothetical protein